MVRDETLLFRGAAIGCLLLIFFLLLRDGVHSWRKDYLPPQLAGESVRRGADIPMQKITSLYPAPPAEMPDLHKGYLFSESREPAAAGIPGTSPDAGGGADGIRISDVMYSGSLIGAETKGIVSYPVAGDKQSRVAGKRLAYKQLVVGDVFLDHEVTAIHADRIVFSLDGQPVEISLFNPAKQRFAVQQQLKGTGNGLAGIAGRKQAVDETAAADKTAATSPETRMPPAMERLRRQSANEPIPAGLRIPFGNTGRPGP